MTDGALYIADNVKFPKRRGARFAEPSIVSLII